MSWEKRGKDVVPKGKKLRTAGETLSEIEGRMTSGLEHKLASCDASRKHMLWLRLIKKVFLEIGFPAGHLKRLHKISTEGWGDMVCQERRWGAGAVA